VPVHVTATDLYIHGNGGYATEVLNNPNLIVDGGHATRTTPIDVDFDFDILLPPKPSDTAILAYSITDGSGNTVNIAPILTPDLAYNKVHVHVPLADSGISPNEVYARHINVGWAYPTNDLHHLRVTLTKMILHDDMESRGSDAKLTFSWLNIDKAGSNAWQRLSDNTNGDLDDYDDDRKFFGLPSGDGEMDFNGPTFDFYIADGKPVSIRGHAYEQDGYDDLFGNHAPFIIQTPSYASAWALGGAEDDLYNVFNISLQAPNYNSSVKFPQANPGNQYELIFQVEDIPLLPEEINKAPIARLNTPEVVLEGQSIVLSSAGSTDLDGFIHDFQWDFNYDGLHFDKTTIDSTDASPTLFVADGPLSQTIALRVIDNLGVPTLVTSTITITNIPPTASVIGDIIGVPGQTRNFTLSATDPSPIDTAAGFTFSVDYGDGTSQTTLPRQSLNVSHIYSAEGANKLKITATDKDGGISDVVTHTVEIKAAAIIPDPNDPTQTDLFVGGTPGDDQINVTQQGASGVYSVSLNGQFKGNFSPTRRIVIYAIGGNDTIRVPNSYLPVEMYGSTGNDNFDGGVGKVTMYGGADDDTYNIDSLNDVTIEYPNQGNHDTIIASFDYTLGANFEDLTSKENSAALNGTGNEGSNIITGNSANNILNGGDGNDRLIGGRGADILTGGSGSDTFVYTDITDAGDMIMDFTVGSDKIEIKDVLKSRGYGGSNPMTDGYLSVRQVNAGLTSVQFDPDGLGNLFRPAPFILLKNVQASTLDINSFVFKA
jgi:Ca2+-binding RTX toxin-like protein